MAITIRTEEVFLNVTVRDSLGRGVDGLKADDFFIYDNGRRYEPLHFETRRAPVRLVLLLDEAAGVFVDTETINQAVLSFRRRLDPEDRIAVMRFSDEVELTQDWRNDEAALARALKAKSLSAGKRAIYDALVLASTKLNEVTGRRAIILLTAWLQHCGWRQFPRRDGGHSRLQRHALRLQPDGGHKTYVRPGHINLKPNPDFRAAGDARIRFVSAPARILPARIY